MRHNASGGGGPEGPSSKGFPCRKALAAAPAPSAGLWRAWLACVHDLRPACPRLRTFWWVAVALLGLCTRADPGGVAAWVRGAGLKGACYKPLLRLFEGPAVKADALARRWVPCVLARFRPVEAAGHRVAVLDGLKVPKEGRRMPGVRALHQASQNNSKPPFIMGHSFQAVGLLAEAGAGTVCVPLASRLHEGVNAGAGDGPTLPSKAVALFLEVAGLLEKPVLLVADAYYCTRTVVDPVVAAGHHLLTRVRANGVAWCPPPPPPARRGRGRPRLYGAKVRLRDAWDGPGFKAAPSPAYGEKNVTIQYLCRDLLWRPGARPLRFVWVDHPTRGRAVFATTHTGLDPLDIVRLYALRFKVEVSFKAALHTVGAYAHRFWMKGMRPTRRREKDRALDAFPADQRAKVLAKLAAYDLHAQLGCVAQGLLQHLAVHHRAEVWARFRGWMRTMRPDAVPSEAVAAHALRAALPEFLLADGARTDTEKFLRDRVDWERAPGIAMHPDAADG